MKPDIFSHEPDRKANPEALAANPELVPHMTSQNSRNGIAGTADKLPPVYRAGSMDHEKIPSRVGRHRTFRDGTSVEVAR